MAQQTNKDCIGVINKCDAALKQKDAALKLSDLAIDKCIKGKADLTAEVGDLRSSSNAWYHNPFVMTILGVAAGITLSQTVFK